MSFIIMLLLIWRDIKWPWSDRPVCLSCVSVGGCRQQEHPCLQVINRYLLFTTKPSNRDMKSIHLHWLLTAGVFSTFQQWVRVPDQWTETSTAQLRSVWMVQWGSPWMHWPVLLAHFTKAKSPKLLKCLRNSVLRLRMKLNCSSQWPLAYITHNMHINIPYIIIFHTIVKQLYIFCWFLVKPEVTLKFRSNYFLHVSAACAFWTTDWRLEFEGTYTIKMY